jgi:hypothetical protein
MKRDHVSLGRSAESRMSALGDRGQHSKPQSRPPAQVVKAVLPLINSGAVVAREPNVFDPATLPKHQVEAVLNSPLGVTMDDCCRIAELLLGGPPEQPR